jgi:hypothetical protein
MVDAAFPGYGSDSGFSQLLSLHEKAAKGRLGASGSALRELLEDEKLLQRIEWTNWILVVVTTLSAGLFFSWRIAGGVLLGAGLMTISFQVLKWQLRKAFKQPGTVPGKGALFAKYYVRFLATVFLVFTVIYYDWVNPIAFLVGLSLVMVSIVYVGMEQFVIMLLKGDR